jgi:hypothetical protein
MCKDCDAIAELEMEQLADLADALDFESKGLIDMLFELEEGDDKQAAMNRVMDIEKLLIDIKKYILNKEL